MTMTAFDVSLSPLTEPESMLIDTFVQWRRELDYAAPDYTLSYEIRDEAHTQEIVVEGTYDSSNEWWLFALGQGDYTHIHSGSNRWDMFVTRTSDGERVHLASGTVVVFATADDRRTHAEIMVEKIESLLQGRAAHDIESYSIKSRSLTRMSVKELTEWREYYQAEIDRTGGSKMGRPAPKRNSLRARFV